MMKNEPSKQEIELIAMLAVGFVYETVNELIAMLDLENEKEDKER